MIEIVYDRKKHRVAVRGHAQSGEKGHDLVCAAVSALTYTLAENVRQMSTVSKSVRRPIIDLNEGKATIACDAVHGMDATVTLIFDAVSIGYGLLAAQYKDNVTLKVEG